MKHSSKIHGLLVLVLVMLLALLTGCGGKDEGSSDAGDSGGGAQSSKSASSKGQGGDGPDAMLVSMAEGDLVGAWKGLPASYRDDVQTFLKTFGTTMDATVWDKGFSVANKLVQVMTEKSEYIFGSQMLGAMMAGQGLSIEEQKADWNKTMKALSTILDSDIKTLDGLASLDVEKFLSQGIEGLLDMIPADVPGDSPAGELLQYRNLKTKVLKESGDSATVEVQTADGEKEELAMTKVEGRWVPKEMADTWKADFEQSLAEMDEQLKMDPQQKMMFTGMAGMVEGVADQLLQANSQQEFDQALMSILGALGGGMGGGAPGGGMPGMPR